MRNKSPCLCVEKASVNLAGAFVLPCRAFFSLCGAFSFCVGVRIYAADVFGACKAFLAHCGQCFVFGFVFVMLLFVLVCSVMPLKLSVLRFLCFLGYLIGYNIKVA